MLYKESKVSDINCLYFPILYLKIFCIFHSLCLLLCPVHGRGNKPSQANPSAWASWTSPRIWFHQLFLPTGPSLFLRGHVQTPMTFFSLPDFLKTRYPLTNTNSIHSTPWPPPQTPLGCLFLPIFINPLVLLLILCARSFLKLLVSL